MSKIIQLKLTLHNANDDNPLHLTSLAPQTGWDAAPPHHLKAGGTATCTLETANEVAITLHYGSHHIGINLRNEALNIDPGDAVVSQQQLDGHCAEVTLTMK